MRSHCQPLPKMGPVPGKREGDRGRMRWRDTERQRERDREMGKEREEGRDRQGQRERNRDRGRKWGGGDGGCKPKMHCPPRCLHREPTSAASVTVTLDAGRPHHTAVTRDPPAKAASAVSCRHSGATRWRGDKLRFPSFAPAAEAFLGGGPKI